MRYLSSFFPKVLVGLDLKHKGPLGVGQMIQADLEHLPIRIEKADLIVLNGSVHYLNDPLGFLHDLTTRMKPGAILYVCYPLATWIQKILSVAQGVWRFLSHAGVCAKLSYLQQKADG
jgi:SAM-dependent methyltransferase